MATGKQPEDHRTILEEIRRDLHGLTGAVQGIDNSVKAIAAKQAEHGAQIDKIEENLNGDGSLDDPGIAGEVRSLRAWKKRYESKIVDLIAYIESQRSIWRQVLSWLGMPIGTALGLAIGAILKSIGNGHGPTH